MTRSLLILATSIGLASCAIGAPDEATAMDMSPFTIAGAAGAGGAGGVGGAGGAGGSLVPDPIVPMFTGDACRQGESEACACDGGTMGERTCMANTASPTGGAFSECRNCLAPEDAGAGMGGAASGGASGASGASGGSGGAGGTSPTGGMGAATGGAGGAASCTCMDPLACCLEDGTCGVGVPGLCF